MQWTEIRSFQAEAIKAWFNTDKDILIMASTAAGKTEAAFLPILSNLAKDRGAGSIRVLYVGPLKALINDQFRRLEDLCKRAEIPVYRWHGDVSSSQKKKFVDDPSGVLLITPESLESLLMRKGREVTRLFARLDAIVIDELHAFLDGPRGVQLQSLLERIEVQRTETRARRVGLSATIGDMEIAKRWLRGSINVEPVVIKASDTKEIRLVVKSFAEGPEEGETEKSEGDESTGACIHRIAEEVRARFHGRTNLLFCNRKTDAELLTDHLRGRAGKGERPDEYLIHHGSLSKSIREEVEKKLQSNLPYTAICSSTLELGIDVGSVSAVGQFGPPSSVSSLKQRLGRSGRRDGEASQLWIFLPFLKRTAKDSLPKRLYPGLLQTIAVVDLMVSKWLEPNDSSRLDLSTLIQQTLSVIVERGGVTASDAYKIFSSLGVFSECSPAIYGELLQDLGKEDLLEQIENGDLILGLKGEKITSHYEFYAAFDSSKELTVVEGNRTVGTVEFSPSGFEQGKSLLLAGKRWEIIDVDFDRKIIMVRPTSRKLPLAWSGTGVQIHRKIRETMFDRLTSQEVPIWIDDESADLLTTARKTAFDFRLRESSWARDDLGLYLFTWTSSQANATLYIALQAGGIEPWDIDDFGLGLRFTGSVTRDRVEEMLERFVESVPDPVSLVLNANWSQIPTTGKHTFYLTPPLRSLAYASANLDVPVAVESAKRILEMK